MNTGRSLRLNFVVVEVPSPNLGGYSETREELGMT